MGVDGRKEKCRETRDRERETRGRRVGPIAPNLGPRSMASSLAPGPVVPRWLPPRPPLSGARHHDLALRRITSAHESWRGPPRSKA